MDSYQNSILRRSLPLASFLKLRSSLQQIGQRVATGTPLDFLAIQGTPRENFTLFLTENIISSLEIALETLPEKFALLVSERFSAMLVAKQVGGTGDSETVNLSNSQFLEVGLTFDPAAIAAFLNQLGSLLPHNPRACETLFQASKIIRPNDATIQSEFTLLLLETISFDGQEDASTKTDYPHVWVCQPVQEALHQQVQQERLLNQVTTQIRQSLELPSILKTAVEEVRSFLQADRLVIYQFKDLEPLSKNDSKGNLNSSYPDKKINSSGSEEVEKSSDVNASGESCSIDGCLGRITYEARACDRIPSVLNFAEEGHCFSYVPKCREKYRKGVTLAIEDIENNYAGSDCLLDLLRRTQVRSKLVVPIIVQEQLWGLLIAHQCFHPRQWQEREKSFLKHIAEHLAIAIYQAQLYAEVQQQKQTLEERVIERTQALHDALLAAQSANRAKSEFLATMSHELRTPLTCVIGLSATLLRWSFGQLTIKQREYLQTIYDNGEHLLQLINDILDLSQLEAGKTVLNISEFSLTQIAREALQMVEQKAQKQGVNLAIGLRFESHQDRFLADRKRLKQILFNILSNGIKFTPFGGRVTLRVWWEGNTVVFQVADTGIGISEHQLPLLFQKFQQLDTSYRRQYEGTGLGLALTKQLVELHRGEIDVESTIGAGSAFTVWLPLPPSPNLPNGSRISTSIHLPQGRIVLIEHDEEIATLTCDILTAAGYQTVWIIEGSTAIKQIEIFQPIAAIVEINLDGMDGYEVIRQLRNSPEIPDLKILAISGKQMEPTHLYGVAAEPDDYLLKPVHPKQLLEKIQMLIARG